MKSIPWILAALVAASSTAVWAQQPAPKPAATAAPKAKPAPANPMDAFIADAFKQNEDNLLCPVRPFSAVRANVIEQLKADGVGQSATDGDVLRALYTRFPCPFSPYRAELRPATAADLEGAWVFPDVSQPYRFGPKSPSRPKSRADAIKCEAVGFYAAGEYRTGAVAGEAADCPFSKAADLEPARSRPKVARWSVPRNGRVRIERSDLKDYFEEWDVYAVVAPFRFETLIFDSGELVAYRRAGPDNALNAASEFRHLVRLQ